MSCGRALEHASSGKQVSNTYYQGTEANAWPASLFPWSFTPVSTLPPVTCGSHPASEGLTHGYTLFLYGCNSSA